MSEVRSRGLDPGVSVLSVVGVGLVLLGLAFGAYTLRNPYQAYLSNEREAT